MRGETEPDIGDRKDASSITKRISNSSKGRDSNRLTLTSGDLLTDLSVFQIDQPHQQTLLHAAVTTTREAESEEGIQSSAIFRGTGGGDVAIFTQWMNRRTYDQAPQMLLKPPEQDLYQIAIVDHITGQGASHLAIEDGLFYFINVFPLAPGKHDDLIDFFERTIRIVRVQQGYISTNLLISLDARHAVNIGQYKTRQDFLAMSRRPHVLMAFAQGFRRRIVRRPPRLCQYDLLTVSLYHDTQV
ncbi:MAG TPA: antibiotic biosynthesis monooxygenase [Ktedonobacteraceae bacterium]|nr:antibiotic biosynthesis monooxygenase [Ktedonobacteraceae bacterium]